MPLGQRRDKENVLCTVYTMGYYTTENIMTS